VNWAIDLVWAKSHLDPHMVRWHGILIFATIFVSWLLWTQANHPLWQPHIVVDPVVYWQRALSFHESGGTWAPMGMNEYQPGALWFFAGVMAASGGAGEFDGFLRALMVANLLLLAAHVALARIFVSVRAAWLMLLFALLVGPILLCRFELVVSLLVLLAWIFWRRGLFMPACFLLGTATATKVYPVLFVPLLLVAAWREGRVKQSCAAVFAWLCGGFFIAGALGLFGCDWDDIAAAMRFHFDKPFGVEGLLGSGIPLLQGLLGIPLRMAPRNGIHGFESDLGSAATFVLEWCWLLAFLAVVWAIIARCPRSERCAAPGALFVLFGWYVLLGKLTAPQYAWWALPFLALAPAAWMTRGEWRTLLVTLIAALVAAQFVYPLNYSEFLECFNGSYLSNRIYWLNVLKNILWLCVLVITTRALLRCTADPTPSSDRAT
jgi:hypothetical protein